MSRILVKVKAKGLGHSYNVYPVQFEFGMNGREEDYEEGEISRRVFAKARELTACDKVYIDSTEIIEEN